MANNDNAIDIPRSSSLSMEINLQSTPPANGTPAAASIATTRPPSWWKDVVVYQVWPASFKDSNGDGLGDLRGIISKLDYLRDLGVDVIWLSPMYDSPMEDMGYDVSNYNAIYPPFGTMADMEELIAGLHDRGMRIVLDLVVNHTSSEHKWFKESRKGREGEFADFYMWRDGTVGEDGVRRPPNNWGSVFGGSAWEWVEERQQYYLHIFAKGQPDLNWESKEVRKEIHESALRFWFKKGIDGFRASFESHYPLICAPADLLNSESASEACFMVGWYGKRQDILPTLDTPLSHYTQTTAPVALDFLITGLTATRIDTCNIYSKDPALRDGPVTPDRAPFGDANTGIINGPRIHEYWQEIRKEVLDKFGDPLMVGELALSSFEDTLKFIGREPRELSMVFDFTYTALGGMHEQPWHLTHGFTLPSAKAAMARPQDYVAHPQAWASVFKENHDLPRSLPRFGTKNPAYYTPAAKLLAMMTTALSGTLFIYQGEEIGMTNIPEEWGIEDCKDLNSINYWHRMEEQCGGDKEVMKRVWKGIVDCSRENARTPVQWSGEKHGGFTTGEPWMRVNENYKEINVADQQADKDSVLSFWKRLVKLRKAHKDLFVHGSYHVRDFENKQTWTFEKRADDGTTAWIVLNFSEEDASIDLPAKHGKLALSNLAAGTVADRLKPFEGRVYLNV